MFIVIVGGGKVGTYLSRGLLKQDHEVVVVEKDPKKAQMLATLLENDLAIVGDGCDPNVLAQAGIGRADVVVADTGDDEDNLVVALITLKQANARCIVRVNNPKNKLIFESIDANGRITVISSTELILNLIDEEVNLNDCRPLLRLGGDVELLKLTMEPNAAAIGKTIARVAFPRGTIVVAVERRDGEVVVPNGETLIAAGDDLLVLGKNGSRAEIRAALIGETARV